MANRAIGLFLVWTLAVAIGTPGAGTASIAAVQQSSAQAVGVRAEVRIGGAVTTLSLWVAASAAT
jgi:hypothetical protein